PRAASYQLHLDQQALAKEYGLDWYSAGYQPEATPMNLARGLAGHGPFRVVTLCGHGGQISGASTTLGPRTGVLLRADPPRQDPPGDWLETLWRGEPCDLGWAEFLVQVSCSVGRLSQDGLRDVEGFCVELVLSRARSVLAARWPVHCYQAIDFANAV